MMTPEDVLVELRKESDRIRREGEALLLEADELLTALDEAARAIAAIDMADAR